MRQCEFKKRYDPDMDMHIGKHIYGEGITDIFKSVGRKVFGKTATKAATKAATTAATKTGEYAGKKAGDKIVELLSKKKTETPSIMMKDIVIPQPIVPKTIPQSIVPKTIPQPIVPKTIPKSIVPKLTTQEVDERVNQILSGGKLRRRNFI